MAKHDARVCSVVDLCIVRIHELEIPVEGPRGNTEGIDRQGCIVGYVAGLCAGVQSDVVKSDIEFDGEFIIRGERSSCGSSGVLPSNPHTLESCSMEGCELCLAASATHLKLSNINQSLFYCHLLF